MRRNLQKLCLLCRNFAKVLKSQTTNMLILYNPARHCNIYCNTLSHIYTLHHTARHIATQIATHTATHRNTHCNTLSRTYVTTGSSLRKLRICITQHHTATHCNTHCNTLQHTRVLCDHGLVAAHVEHLHLTTSRCTTLQCTCNIHCNTVSYLRD